MGKKTVYFCDLCQKTVEESKENAEVAIVKGTAMPLHTALLICAECASTKTPEILIKESVAYAQASTDGSNVESVTFKTVSTAGDIVGAKNVLAVAAPK